MIRTSWLVFIVAAALAVGIACTKSSSSPTQPSGVNPGLVGAAADGSTLKATAPTPQSPLNNQLQNGIDPVTLVIANASTTHASNVALTYRFEVYNAAGARVYESNLVTGGANTTSHTLPDSLVLEGEQRYEWRARAEYLGEVGPWSSRGSLTAASTSGYIRGNELYDPLINGKTMGIIHGPVTFIPGKGVSMDSLDSYISYELPQTLTEGEFSILATNVRTNTEGDKTKVLAMAEGYGDITTNNRRFTFEKRNDGTIAWRVITHGDQIDTVGAERRTVRFNLQDTFFFGTAWRNSRVDFTIKQGGAEGETIYSFGKHFNGRAYDPVQHVVYIGGPGGRAGDGSGTVPNIIIRQVWVSSRPRPGFANK